MSFVRKMSALMVALATVSMLGCGGGGASGPAAPKGPKGSAKVKVTHAGKPVTEGILMLDNGNGSVISGKAGADGSFTMNGPQGDSVPVGTYKVSISPETKPPAPGATTMPGPPKIEGVPEKFYSAGTSGVTVEVKEGKQDLTIELK